MSKRLEKQPQGLKPGVSEIAYGTAEAVPLQRIEIIGRLSSLLAGREAVICLKTRGQVLTSFGERSFRVVSRKFVTRLAKGNRRFFAHHPRTEERSGPRSLKMTPALMFGTSGTTRWCLRNSWQDEREATADSSLTTPERKNVRGPVLSE